MIQNAFGLHAACAGIDLLYLLLCQPADEMHVVRHEAIAEQQPLPMVPRPEQRVDNGVGKLWVAKGLALMPGADGEIVRIFGGGVNSRR